MKPDFSIWKQTAIRVLLDLWIPAVPSLGFTIYSTQAQGFNWITFGSSFFTTLFFYAAYFGYIQRARKRVDDERNHKDVIAKQDALIRQLEDLTEELSVRQNILVGRLEDLADDLVGHTTGGDSFCYVWLVGVESSVIYELNVMVEGKYSMHDTSLEITNFESMPAKLAELKRTNNIAAVERSDFRQEMGRLMPGISYHIPCSIISNDENRIRLHLKWRARNGLWYQRMQIEKIGEKWLMATYISRDHEIIFTKASDGYPVDNNGNAIFHEYEDPIAST